MNTSGRSARLPPTPTRHINDYKSAPVSVPEESINQVLGTLSDRERLMILDVLKRDEGVRKREAARIMMIRAELHNLRRRGLQNVSSNRRSTDSDPNDMYKTCARCCIELGRIINRGAPCRSCRLRVCKACREYSTKKFSSTFPSDWICIVCYKQMELQAVSGEWFNGTNSNQNARDSTVSTSELLTKSIRRSWTISSPQQNQGRRLHYNPTDYRVYSSLPQSQDSTDYTYTRYATQFPYINNNNNNNYSNMEYGQFDDINDHQPRRVLRQSTLPSTLPNQEYGSYPPNNQTLLPPGSPKQLINPQFSPYNTDNDEIMEEPTQDMKSSRYPIRRQSTVPCRPNDYYTQSYLSTSPNRIYSRSPERIDGEPGRLCPPFVRQSTFPSNNSSDQPPISHRPKLLPTSPNRTPYNKSPENEQEMFVRRPMMRQATLPNPDQHVKLLPTSPPKRQTSPQYVNVNRSPEFIRQNTAPNIEGMNTLAVHQPKFLPISPRHKQQFLFPQAVQSQNRQFLSHQNVPLVSDDPYSSTGSVSAPREHAAVKMIKVRSHSNEEYGLNRPPEGRRLLPEIPKNRSRSPSRLVRQDHVREEMIRTNSGADQRSPVHRSFAEAKQNLPDYDDMSGDYNDKRYNEHRFLEADEEAHIAENNYNNLYNTENQMTINYDDGRLQHANYVTETTSEYKYQSDEYMPPGRKDRPRRRRSRELPEKEFETVVNYEEPRYRKPEQMRSISEETASKPIKPVARRSMSHPEKESLALRRNESLKSSPKQSFAEILEKQRREKPAKLPSPRRKQYKSFDQADLDTSPISKTMQHSYPRGSADTQLHRDRFEKFNSDSKLKTTGDDSIMQTELTDTQNSSDGPQEHKTTLGEAEIQSAVEAAAVIFKKVVIQRRKAAAESKAKEEGDLCTNFKSRSLSIMQEDYSDAENYNGLKLFNSDSDDYKLVFISSDSSGKEEENEDSSSTTSSVHTRHSMSLDDCDWDYFEPSTSTKILMKDLNSPFVSPYLSRKTLNISPSGTERLTKRRKLTELNQARRDVNNKLCESDIGTDEELLAEPEKLSPGCTTGFLNQLATNTNIFEHKHQSTATHGLNLNTFTASNERIPENKNDSCECNSSVDVVWIPVPIPVPIAALQHWKPTEYPVNSNYKAETNELGAAIPSTQAADIFQLWNSAASNLLFQQQHQTQSFNKVKKNRMSQQQEQEQLNHHCLTVPSNKTTTSRNPIFASSNTQHQHNVLPVYNQSQVKINETTKQLIAVEYNSPSSSGIEANIDASTQPAMVRPSDHEDRIHTSEVHYFENVSCEHMPDVVLCVESQINRKSGNSSIDIGVMNSSHHNGIHQTGDGPMKTDKCDKNNEKLNDINSITSTGGIGNHNTDNSINFVSENIMEENKLEGQLMNVEEQGYLESEQVFSTDSESDEEIDGNIPVHRSYNISNVDASDSIASEYISDDMDRLSITSSSHEDLSSDGDSNTNDCLMVKTRKAKVFHKVFVVNKCDSTSDSNTSSSNSETDTDNDTDTERECGITLNYFKPLNNDGDEKSEIHMDSVNADGNEVNGNLYTCKKALGLEDSVLSAADKEESICLSNIVNDNSTGDTDELTNQNTSSKCTGDQPFDYTDQNNDIDAITMNNSDNESPSNTINEPYKIENDLVPKHESVRFINEILNKPYVSNPSSDVTENNNRNLIDQIVGSVSCETLGDCTNSSNLIQSSETTVQLIETDKIESIQVPNEYSVIENTEDSVVDLDEIKPENMDKSYKGVNKPKLCNEVIEVNDVDKENIELNTESESELKRDDELSTAESVVESTTISNVEYKSINHMPDETQASKPTSPIASSIADQHDRLQICALADVNLVVDERSFININEETHMSDHENPTKNISGELECKEITCSETKQEPGIQRNETEQTVEVERSQCTDGSNYNGCAAKYTSRTMITQNQRTNLPASQVCVVTSDMTRIVPEENSVIVQHTNHQLDCEEIALNQSSGNNGKNEGVSNKIISNSIIQNDSSAIVSSVVEKQTSVNNDEITQSSVSESIVANERVNDDVTVVTGANTLSAVVCLEDGLADDDSWVEEISQDEDEFATTTTESDVDSNDENGQMALMDREEELRGYHKMAIDFTLHTIVEESCEESEVEPQDKKKNRLSASDLEKYFFYGLGDGKQMPTIDAKDDSISETSSICSEGIESLNGPEDNGNDSMHAADLASSRLEKYFLCGFMGFSGERRDSDGSGSVGSDSEGHQSPEQRRKRLVRARGTPRSHNSSLDNLLATKDEHPENLSIDNVDESLNSSETDTYDETLCHGDRNDDTLKRKKQSKKRHDGDELKKSQEFVKEIFNEISDDERKTPRPDYLNSNLSHSKKQTSRDSGFVGSNDDLLKNDDISKTGELKLELEEIKEDVQESKIETDSKRLVSHQNPLIRKDSFNNWSSDEETNLMMNKMRQFFKTVLAASTNAQNLARNSNNSTPVLSGTNNSENGTPISEKRNKNKPPQLIYFESELTRLMKTVPGINDDQVREIVVYLSSEDTWSDSYDSSDYTSSDLENCSVRTPKSDLQEQISASCQQIIKKFEAKTGDEEGDRGDGGVLLEDPQGVQKETALVYQKLVASFSKIATPAEIDANSNKSPPMYAKVVMQHIGSRLVSLMHEVSSSESHKSNSPKPSRYHHHRKLQQKISATTTEDDDSTSDSNVEKTEDLGFINLPRSKSHDLLLGGGRLPHHQSSSGVSDITGEEKETSDYERFSWRGSFESALLANGDSRTKLSQLEKDNSSSIMALAAKRRSAGDLLFNQKSLSREQLDRVRSCGSIGASHDIEGSKLWTSSEAQLTGSRRSSVPDAGCDSSDEDEKHFGGRSTLPRSLQTINSTSTNSLPRLSTTNLHTASTSTMQKSHSVFQFLPNSVKSARYRPPGFNRPSANTLSKKAVSTPGLQQSLYTKRDARKHLTNLTSEDQTNLPAEMANSPLIGNRCNLKPSGDITSPSPSKGSASSDPWPSQSEEDIDRLVAMHQNRSSLSSLGIRSDSMASVYSGAGDGRHGTVVVKGHVEFGMQYNYKLGALEIHVVQCKDLAAVDTKRNRSDPYVKVYLLPDKSKSGKRKTKVKKHTLNPIFDESLKFYMPLMSLESRTVWLTVWHSDMFGRNDFLGEVTVNLQGRVFDNPQPQWYSLQERSEPYDDISIYKGDIIVGLKFVPPESVTASPHHHSSTGSLNLRKFGSMKSSLGSRSSSSKGALHVLVKEAKNLSPVKASGTCDAFCKSYLLPDRNKGSKQKTPVVKRSINPVWNYTFVYDDVSLQELSERALELTMWDHDRLASNEFLGGVRFSLGTGKHYTRTVDWMDATGKELTLWQSMLNRPNFWVEGCVILRSSLDYIRGSP